ncbi:Thylakoid membrane protein [Nymphaea thermarum]|nr:Thylakoid membrane protein [Nymphaea thermarum]
MGVASLVHHPVHLPLPGLIKLSPPQFSVRKPKKSWKGRCFSSLPSSRVLRCPCPLLSSTPLESNYRLLGRIFSPISCYRDSEQDGVAYSEYVENEGSQADEDAKTSSSVHSNRSLGSHKESKEEVAENYLSSIRTVVFWVCAAVAFGTFVGFKEGVDKASEFFAGYLLEQSLSVDNLFVFVLIFKYFKVPPPYQKRVLSYGIAGAIVFRAIMIALGTATIERFEAVNLLLAAVLLYSSYKLFEGDDEEEDLSNNFILKLCQKFIPVTSYYDEDRFFTLQDGIKKDF